MVAFLVEVYCSAAELSAGKPRLDELARATRDLWADALPVRLVHAVFLPADETCFYLFEGASIDEVREAAQRVGLRFDRLTEAVSAWPTPLRDVPASNLFASLLTRRGGDDQPTSDASKEVRPCATQPACS